MSIFKKLRSKRALKKRGASVSESFNQAYFKKKKKYKPHKFY